MAELLKNGYDPEFFDTLSAVLEQAYPAFDRKKFRERVYRDDWDALELKQRMRRIAETLGACLPPSYLQSLEVLKQAAPHFSGLFAMFFPDFVEIMGLDEPDISIPALAFFTRYSSSEFAVRPFILRYPDRMLEQLAEWAQDDNEHIRRLASEGCRPRLPWAMALPRFKKDPVSLLPILELLKTDTSEYVRRSVANNLNDIAKDNPGIVLEVARKWLGRHPDTDRIVKHGCRTLLKKGDPAALALFGLADAEGISVKELALTPGTVRIGGDLALTFQMVNASETPRKLRIELAVDYLKARGRYSRKLFKLSEKPYGPGDSAVRTVHSFKQLSTRTHYPGEHFVSVVVNGREMAKASFLLEP